MREIAARHNDVVAAVDLAGAADAGGDLAVKSTAADVDCERTFEALLSAEGACAVHARIESAAVDG